MNIGFVAGLSDHKLAQKLAPLQAMPEVSRILLFRREPFAGNKVAWHPLPSRIGRHPVSGDLWRMAQLLRHGGGCDLLIGCHQRFHGVMAATAGRILGVPSAQLIITEFDLVWGDPLFRWAIRQAALVGFRGGKAWAQAAERWPSAPPVMFIPPNLFLPSAETAPGLPVRRDLDVLFVGSFTHDKNIPLLARVLAGVRAGRGALRACVIGQGPERGRFQDELARFGIADAVVLLENQPQEQLGGYYARAKLLLLPSRFEGLPMVVPEAMGRGTPVVATDVGHLSEIVVDGENGFLAPSGDHEGLTQAALRILGDPELADRLSAGARAAHGHFVTASTMEAAVTAWRAAFRELSRRHLLPTVADHAR